MRRPSVFLIALSLLLPVGTIGGEEIARAVTPAAAADEPGNHQNRSSSKHPQQVKLHFYEVELHDLWPYIMKESGKTVKISPETEGYELTLFSDELMSREEAYARVMSKLRSDGLDIEETQHTIVINPGTFAQSLDDGVTDLDLRALSIDELLGRLPPRNRQSYRDAVARVMRLHAVSREILRRIEQGRVGTAEWHALLVRGGVIRSRARWPEDLPFEVELDRPPWLRSGIEIRARHLVNDGRVIRCGRTWVAPCGLGAQAMRSQEPAEDLLEAHGPLGVLSPGTTRVVFALELRSGGNEPSPSTSWADADSLYSGKLSVPVTLVDSIDDAIKPVRDASVDESVRNHLEITVYSHAWADRSVHGYLLIELDRRFDPILRYLGFGLVVELRRDAEVVQTVEIGGCGLRESAPGQYKNDSVELPSMVDRFDALRGDELARWRVHVRGEGRLALTDWTHDRYWAGAYSIPLEEVLVRR